MGEPDANQTGMAKFERASRLPRREAPSARSASDWGGGRGLAARKLLRSITADRSSRGRGSVELASRGARRAIGVEIRDQLALTLPSTVHIDTDGLDPARSNMIGAAGGSPDALIAITALSIPRT
jgi:hypothetical protein